MWIFFPPFYRINTLRYLHIADLHTERCDVVTLRIKTTLTKVFDSGVKRLF